MAQIVSKNATEAKKEKPLNLRQYYTYGLSLLQLMVLLGLLGLALIGVYEFCSGGTAG